MKTQLWAILVVIFAGVFGAFGPIYFKRGSLKINLKDFSTIYLNKDLIIGVLIYGVTSLMFIPALKGGELSVLYPIVGLAYVWVCIYSTKLLGEKMNLLKWAGIIIVIIGVGFIGAGA